MEAPKFCRKCFLAEMKRQGISEETYRAMLERIESMDPELRCTKEVYEERLAVCKKCEYLVEAMCALCEYGLCGSRSCLRLHDASCASTAEAV